RIDTSPPVLVYRFQLHEKMQRGPHFTPGNQGKLAHSYFSLSADICGCLVTDPQSSAPVANVGQSLRVAVVPYAAIIFSLSPRYP
ncbi:MAG: hypothetical protein ACTH9E_21330, partial [Serratia proteamaculans]